MQVHQAGQGDQPAGVENLRAGLGVRGQARSDPG